MKIFNLDLLVLQITRSVLFTYYITLLFTLFYYYLTRFYNSWTDAYIRISSWTPKVAIIFVYFFLEFNLTIKKKRYDRDDYIIVHRNDTVWQKLNESNSINIGEYDLKSIMHYPCSNGTNCNTIPLGKENLTGQRKKLSDIDIYRIKKLYKCSY